MAAVGFVGEFGVVGELDSGRGLADGLGLDGVCLNVVCLNGLDCVSFMGFGGLSDAFNSDGDGVVVAGVEAWEGDGVRDRGGSCSLNHGSSRDSGGWRRDGRAWVLSLNRCSRAIRDRSSWDRHWERRWQ